MGEAMEQERCCWGHREMAGEVIRTREAFFKVQKENRMEFWLLRFPPHPSWLRIPAEGHDMCPWPEPTRKISCQAMDFF